MCNTVVRSSLHISTMPHGSIMKLGRPFIDETDKSDKDKTRSYLQVFAIWKNSRIVVMQMTDDFNQSQSGLERQRIPHNLHQSYTLNNKTPK